MEIHYFRCDICFERIIDQEGSTIKSKLNKNRQFLYINHETLEVQINNCIMDVCSNCDHKIKNCGVLCKNKKGFYFHNDIKQQ